MRLEIMQDLPKGKTLWMIDQSDMAKAKATVGKIGCMFGNVPSALLALGTPQEVKDYVKKCIDVAGQVVVTSYAMEHSLTMQRRKTSKLWSNSLRNTAHTNRYKTGWVVT
jgi:hypothetical protein